MPDLDLVVPSALLDAPLARELLAGAMRDGTVRTLEHLVSRASSRLIDLPDEAGLASWQAWVFATSVDQPFDTVNVAELSAIAGGRGPLVAGRRYAAEPAHFKVANDHLRLDDPGALDITLDECNALARAVEPVLAEAGWGLEPLDAATMRHWLLVRTDDAALSAPASERAIGDNVARWQPRVSGPAGTGPDAALAWRRCVNEVQMTWFVHPVNAAREAAGLPVINTLWLSGNGAPRSSLPRYAAVRSTLPLMTALPIERAATRELESFDGFVGPARRDDWSGWREQLAVFDARIATIVASQARGVIGEVRVALCGRDRVRVLTLGAKDGRKFWRAWRARDPLEAVFGEGAEP